MNDIAREIVSYTVEPGSSGFDSQAMNEALDEFEEHFDKDNVEVQLLELEGALVHHSEDGTNLVQGLFREVHSMKGTAGMLKIDPLAHFLHIYEDVLGIISNNVMSITSVKKNEILDFFLQGLDLVEKMIDKLRENANYVFKDNKEFFGFYIRLICEARTIVSNPEDFLEFNQVSDEAF